MKKFQLLLVAFLSCLLFFAGCKKEEYIVTFHPSGGKGDIVTQQFTQKVAQPLMANLFTNYGYAFAGWNTVPNGTGVIYKDLESIIVSGNMILYAQWTLTADTYFVHFHANEGIGSMEAQRFIENRYQELTANSFTRTDSIFTGWNTKADGSGNTYRNKERIKIYENLDLFAQWALSNSN